MADSDEKGVTVDSALLDSKGRLRNLQCPRPGCGRLYSSESALRNHIRLKHPFQGLKPKRTATEGARRGSTGSVGMPDNWRYTATRWPVQLPAQGKQDPKSIVLQPPLLAPRRASGGDAAPMVGQQYAAPKAEWEGAPYHPDKVHYDPHSVARQESTASSQWSAWDEQQQYGPPAQPQAPPGPPTQYVQMVLPPPQAYPEPGHYHSQPVQQHQGPPPGEWAHEQHQQAYAPQPPQPEPHRPAYTPFHPWEDRPRPATPPVEMGYAPPYVQQQPPMQYAAPGHHAGCVCPYCQHPPPPQHMHHPPPEQGPPPPGYTGHHAQCPCSGCAQWQHRYPQHYQPPPPHEGYHYAWGQQGQQWEQQPPPVPVTGQ